MIITPFHRRPTVHMGVTCMGPQPRGALVGGRTRILGASLVSFFPLDMKGVQGDGPVYCGPAGLPHDEASSGALEKGL